MEANQLSREAFDRLQAELDDLTTRGRIEVAEKIEQARELGDLSENGDYHAAKDEQGHMEGRIRQLEALLENVEIIEPPAEGDARLLVAARFGAVRLTDNVGVPLGVGFRGLAEQSG